VQFTLRKGLKTRTGSLRGPVAEPSVRTVGFLGADYPGVVFDLKVAEGDPIIAGQTLCVDRHRAEIAFVASAAGRVHRIRLGARRRLEAIEIACEGRDYRTFDAGSAAQGGDPLRALLLQSGAWASFRTRPFGHVPDPFARPHAIFVTATDSNSLAADPAAVLAPQLEMFRRGAETLLHLTEGPVYICQSDSGPLVVARDRMRVATFSGPHPSGLPGTQIHHILPVSRQRTVWQIGYQDVAAIGHLLETGRVMARRILSVGGAGLSDQALLKAPLGAKLADLVDDRGSFDATQLMSGPALSGQRTEYLRRHDLQVTVTAPDRPEILARTFWQRQLDRIRTPTTGATLPLEGFERAFPFDLLPVPLLRALAVGDVETAERLGCLELLEDDLAVLSHLCPSGSDYGMLLRRTLDILAEERAA
jgi:Na+-transporting NADH:ubiquinone oxidoreductase subunit A